MRKEYLFFCLLTGFTSTLHAQQAPLASVEPDTIQTKNIVVHPDTANLSLVLPADTTAEEPGEVPVISYSLTPRQYEIADIKISGVKNYEDFVLIGFSGLSVGDKVNIPGDEITAAIKRFWKHGLFSDVKIAATKTTKDKVWLEIQLEQRPKISEVKYSGVKKGERGDLEEKVGLPKGSQLTPNLLDRAKILIKKYFDEKGFSAAEINITQQPDQTHEGMVILHIDIDKNEKTKIHEIILDGNENLSDKNIKKVMKKTNEGFDLVKRFWLSWRKLFSTKKFIETNYREDLANVINKYNELGYRDARIVLDSVWNYDEKHVNIRIDIEEGEKYYLRNVTWVGNTQYPTDYLMMLLNMKPGDVYNQKKLNERLQSDDDAIASIYYNNGYIFFDFNPVELNVENDSIDLEIRIVEGTQATINKVIINGNDRLYEDVVRRELWTRPGELFSKEDLQRSARELAQMGHFDPESMDIKPLPDPENGTVDIQYNLTSKANDQVEFSAGYGQTGIIGRLSLKFTNFSLKNLLNPSSYKGILPQGEGQTLTISGQTNARFYQSYSISFLDPWFGGKRPNSLSVGAYYMRQTGVNTDYYNNYMNSMYGYGYGYGYGSYGGYGDYDYSAAYDPDKSFQMVGVSVGYGKRLTWPDDYFQFMAELSYQRYMLSNWDYFIINNGNCNNINLGLTLSRSSTDNPLYTRRGSQFSLSVAATPPFSLWEDGSKYENLAYNDGSKYRWIEYHKWKFKGKIFTPLANPETVIRTPVMMSRIEYGFVGHYNSKKISPFETFYMGGDGMTGYSSTYATETIGLRGYNNGSLTPYGREGYAYSRLAMELRYPFLLEPTSTIYGLVFAEAGNAWSDIKAFNPFDLKRSAGVGVRIFLPMIGMMGIDWAYGFDKVFNTRSYGGSQFHFILGQEF
jgi:outer membrane protein insertion porin family